MNDEEIRKQILAVLKDCQYDFDYGYSKAVSWLHVKMVDRNKASYKLLELYKKLNSEQNAQASVATEADQGTEAGNIK